MTTPFKPFPFHYSLIVLSLNDGGELLRPSLNKPGVYKNYKHDELGLLGCNVVSLGVYQTNMVPSSSGAERIHKNWLLISSGHNEASMAAPMYQLHSNLHRPRTSQYAVCTHCHMLRVKQYSLVCCLCLTDNCCNRSCAICLYQVSKFTFQ